MEYITILNVRVGDRDRPAAAEDITDVAENLQKLIDEAKPNEPLVYVSHHAIAFESVRVPLRDGRIHVAVSGAGVTTAKTEAIGIPGVPTDEYKE